MVNIDPALLLARAREAEPGLRLTERTAALDELAAHPDVAHWQDELDAERAVDLARLDRRAEAEQLARAVLDRTDSAVAEARATEALARARAWSGTDGASSAAAMLFDDAAHRYAGLGEREWRGNALYLRATTIDLQNGALDDAVAGIREALRVLPQDSPRRAMIDTFLGDALASTGRFAEAHEALDEANHLGAAADDHTALGYSAWSRAALYSMQGDPALTERYLLEAERHAADWFDIDTGAMFLAQAAEFLDRVGERAAARRYLERAEQRLPDDPFVRQARAVLLARSGNPDRALSALQELSRGEWLEKRLLWRHALFAAWATLRAGRSGAAELAARAFELSTRAGGVQVALVTEPEISQALLPLAERAGSLPARAALAGEHGLIVRLLGAPTLMRADGPVVPPPGQAAQLCRMLAAQPEGLPVTVVLDALFPEAPEQAARQRLRQVLTRLRASAGDVVVRDGDQLRLVPAWVDIWAFRAASDKAVDAGAARRAELAYAALALWTGSPLPVDPFASWATPLRDRLRRRYVELLDIVADDAAARGSTNEALRALASAREEDPYDESRYLTAARLLIAAGRRGAAVTVARAARAALADIDVPLPAELADLLPVEDV